MEAQCIELRNWIFLVCPAMFDPSVRQSDLGQQVQILFTDERDRILWEIGRNKMFSTSSLCAGFYQKWPQPLYFEQIWHAMMLPRIIFFGWLSFQRWLPTLEFLINRGCNSISDNICPFCSQVEIIDHTLIFCRQSWMVWCRAFKRFTTQATLLARIYDFLQLWRSYLMHGLQRDFATSIWFSTA